MKSSTVYIIIFAQLSFATAYGAYQSKTFNTSAPAPVSVTAKAHRDLAEISKSVQHHKVQKDSAFAQIDGAGWDTPLKGNTNFAQASDSLTAPDRY